MAYSDLEEVKYYFSKKEYHFHFWEDWSSVSISLKMCRTSYFWIFLNDETIIATFSKQLILLQWYVFKVTNSSGLPQTKRISWAGSWSLLKLDISEGHGHPLSLVAVCHFQWLINSSLKYSVTNSWVLIQPQGVPVIIYHVLIGFAIYQARERGFKTPKVPGSESLEIQQQKQLLPERRRHHVNSRLRMTKMGGMFK